MRLGDAPMHESTGTRPKVLMRCKLMCTVSCVHLTDTHVTWNFEATAKKTLAKDNEYEPCTLQESL